MYSSRGAILALINTPIYRAVADAGGQTTLLRVYFGPPRASDWTRVGPGNH